MCMQYITVLWMYDLTYICLLVPHIKCGGAEGSCSRVEAVSVYALSPFHGCIISPIFVASNSDDKRAKDISDTAQLRCVQELLSDQLYGIRR